MNEKILGLIGTLGCILIGVLASLIAWFCGGKELQTSTKEIIRQMLNFEITLAIVGAISMLIPLIGAIIAMVLYVVNIFFAVVSFLAIQNNKEFKAPAYEFIK